MSVISKEPPEERIGSFSGPCNPSSSSPTSFISMVQSPPTPLCVSVLRMHVCSSTCVCVLRVCVCVCRLQVNSDVTPQALCDLFCVFGVSLGLELKQVD